MHVHALAWIVLAGIIVTMIVVDIVGHVRTPPRTHAQGSDLVVHRLHSDRPDFWRHRLGRVGGRNTDRNTWAATSPRRR